jgi:capsular exopolysaccharide synthesis family protein
MDFARLRSPTDVLGMFVRRFGLLVTVSLVVIAAMVVYTVTRVPLYSSASEIAVDPDGGIPRPAAPGSDAEQGVVEAQMRLVKSPAVAAAVADQLNLASNPEWNLPATSNPTTARVHAIRELMDRVSVTRDEVAPTMVIATTSRDPQLAAAIVNATARQYLAMGQQSLRAAAGNRTTVLDKELDKAADAFSSATAKLAQYRASHGLTGSAALGTAIDQQAAATAGELAAAQSEADKASATAAAARSLAAQGQGDAVTEVIGSPVITDLKRQQAELASQAAEIKVRYGPDHPKAKRVAEQLADIDGRITREESRVTASLDSAATAASSRAGTLAATLGALRGQQASAMRATGEADDLQQFVETQRQAYANLAALATRASQVSKVAFAPGRLVVPGIPATIPSYPKKMLLLGLAMIAGPALGILAVLLAEAFDSRVRRAEEITALPGVRHLSSVGLLTRRTLRKVDRDIQPWDYVLARPMSSFAESIRSIRLRLIASATPGTGLVVCVTSAVSNEGKSTLSASLARTMALAGDKVLLIDCDLRRNGLAGMVTTRPEAGLSEVLDGSRSVVEAIVHDAAPGLDVLPLIEPRFTPHDVFGDGTMRRLLDRLRASYSFIIIDAPPVLAVDDAAILAGLADRVLLAVRWGSTRIEALRIAVSRLRDAAEGVIGIVLTAVSPRAGAAGGYRDAHYYLMTAHGYHLD